jgi:hypothetical protein
MHLRQVPPIHQGGNQQRDAPLSQRRLCRTGKNHGRHEARRDDGQSNERHKLPTTGELGAHGDEFHVCLSESSERKKSMRGRAARRGDRAVRLDAIAPPTRG